MRKKNQMLEEVFQLINEGVDTQIKLYENLNISKPRINQIVTKLVDTGRVKKDKLPKSRTFKLSVVGENQVQGMTDEPDVSVAV